MPSHASQGMFLKDYAAAHEALSKLGTQLPVTLYGGSGTASSAFGSLNDYSTQEVSLHDIGALICLRVMEHICIDELWLYWLKDHSYHSFRLLTSAFAPNTLFLCCNANRLRLRRPENTLALAISRESGLESHLLDILRRFCLALLW